MNQVPLTVRGAEKLREELERLKRIERPRIIEAIAEARAHGDLKENAEYHAAREQQGFVEGRIQDIEGKLANAQIIDVTQLAPTGVSSSARRSRCWSWTRISSTLPDRRRGRGRSEAGQDLGRLAHRPLPDRQERGRCHLGAGARRRAGVRDSGGAYV
jgi:hypothetical protein